MYHYENSHASSRGLIYACIVYPIVAMGNDGVQYRIMIVVAGYNRVWWSTMIVVVDI